MGIGVSVPLVSGAGGDMLVSFSIESPVSESLVAPQEASKPIAATNTANII